MKKHSILFLVLACLLSTIGIAQAGQGCCALSGGDKKSSNSSAAPSVETATPATDDASLGSVSESAEDAELATQEETV